MQIVSACCHAAIEPKHDREYPLGGSTWYINTVVEACTGCGEEHPETVECCDCCGEATELLIETRLGGWCQECILLNSEDLIEREVAV